MHIQTQINIAIFIIKKEINIHVINLRVEQANSCNSVQLETEEIKNISHPVTNCPLAMIIPVWGYSLIYDFRELE